MKARSFPTRLALRLACTLLAFAAPATAARGGFVVISQPDAAYQASTIKFDIPTSGPPVSSLTAGDLTISLSNTMNPTQFTAWGTLPFVESTAPPSLGFGVFGASSRVLTFNQPLSTFGVEMRYNLQPFFVPFNLTAQFFHDGILVGTITRSFSAGTGARLFAATDVEEPFTSVRLSAPSGAQGFHIANVRATAVPEPSSLALLGAGLVGWMGFGLRRRQAALRRQQRPRLEALEDRCVLSTAGFLDPTFGAPHGYVITSPNPSSSFRQSLGNDIAVYPTVGNANDGKIVVVGMAPNSNGVPCLAVLRYNANGTPDPAFGSGGLVITNLSKPNFTVGGRLNGVALQPDGKIVVAGLQYLSHTGLVYDVEWVLARYNTNGTLDKTFGGGRKPTGIAEINLGPDRDEANKLQIQPNGKIVVVGMTTRSGTGNDVAIGRFNANGTPDTTFGSNGFAYPVVNTAPVAESASNLVLQPDGPNEPKIVVVGGGFVALRLLGNGSLDTTFNGTGVVPSTGGSMSSVLLQPDGSIVAAGGDASGAVVARYTSTGALDPTFGSGGWATISGLSYASDIVLRPGTSGAFDVAGVYTSPTPTDSGVVARLQADGSLDTSFGANAGLSSYFAPNGNTGFNAMALQSDGNIVVTGNTYVSSTYPRAIVVARYFGETTASASLAGLSLGGGARGTDAELPMDVVFSTWQVDDGLLVALAREQELRQRR